MVKSEFLDYLYCGSCINEEQKEMLLAASGDSTIDYNLLAGNFNLIDLSRVSEPVLQCVQLIISEGLMSLEQIEDKLLNFELDRQLGNLTADLLIGESDISPDMFINAFLSGFLLSAKELSAYNPEQGSKEILESFHYDCLCYQKLEGNQNFFVGITADLDVFKDIAEEFYNRIMPAGNDEERFSGEKEDIIDAMLEFLNNVTSNCTYDSNSDFELQVPEYVEDGVISAGEIHKIDFSLDEKSFAFLIISGWEYNFGQGV